MPLDSGWMAKANCKGVDTEIFFPKSKGKGIEVDSSQAKALCARCEVRKTCLAYAIAHSVPAGVWGGLTHAERAKLPKKLRSEVKQLWFDLHPLSKPMSNALGTYTEGN